MRLAPRPAPSSMLPAERYLLNLRSYLVLALYGNPQQRHEITFALARIHERMIFPFPPTTTRDEWLTGVYNLLVADLERIAGLDSLTYTEAAAEEYREYPPSNDWADGVYAHR